MRSKANAIKSHAKRRFKERAGIELTPSLHTEIIAKIQSGKLKLLKKPSNYISIWRYGLDDKDYRLVYDNRRHLVVTIIPIENFFKEWLRDRVEFKY